MRVTFITGEAPNLPWWKVVNMTREEIDAYNNRFLKRETVEVVMEGEMSEMVERAARALEEATKDGLIAGDWEEVARVVIEAMREPTKSIEAQSWSEGFAGDLWRQMIDTALTDDKK